MTKIKAGTSVKIIGDCNIPIGTKTKVISSHQIANDCFTTEYNPIFWISIKDVEIIPLTKLNLQELTIDIDNKISELNKEKNLIEDKITYLEETGSKEFDETEYKVYQTLKLLNVNNLTDIDKAKLIAQLINN